MATKVQSNFRYRRNLGRVGSIVDIPNLIDIQKSSYDKFLQAERPPRERQEVGLEAVFRSVFRDSLSCCRFSWRTAKPARTAHRGGDRSCRRPCASSNTSTMSVV